MRRAKALVEVPLQDLALQGKLAIAAAKVAAGTDRGTHVGTGTAGETRIAGEVAEGTRRSACTP